MNETKNAGASPANDRRRADIDGNPRDVPGVQAQESAEAELSQAAPEGVQGQPPAEDPRLVEANAEAARLRQELEASRKRVDELARAFQAVNQDREEFKQRLTRERERLIDVEKGNVALTLLEGLDELDRCLGASANDNSPLAQGVRLIRDKMLAKLQSMGIERMALIDKPFDPNLADAVDMEITTNPEDDQKVIAEIHPCYTLKGRVVRPGRVKVAKYVKPAEA